MPRLVRPVPVDTATQPTFPPIAMSYPQDFTARRVRPQNARKVIFVREQIPIKRRATQDSTPH